MTNANRHIELLKAGIVLPEKELKYITLLTPGSANTKLAKGEGKGYSSYILHLSPSKLSGWNVCPGASKGCAAACLNTAGRGRFDNIQRSRLRKTLLFVKMQGAFMSKLFNEVASIERRAKREGMIPVVRLNGTSDLPWENIKVNGKNVFESFPEVQFYDYTKVFNRLKSLKDSRYENYHVTFSRSESNEENAIRALGMGFNVAVVFRDVPSTWNGWPTLIGDKDDLRFLDPKGRVVALIAKGKAKKDVSGFVVKV